MNEFLPGFEPDAAERAKLRFVNGALDLRQGDITEIEVIGNIHEEAAENDLR